MEDYKILLTHVEDLSKKSAKFRRVILHSHSPQSHDFGKEKKCDKSLNERTQYLEIAGGEDKYLKHLIGKYEFVAVTDHMRVNFACRLAAVARNIEDICVLPGIEINLRLAPPLHGLRLHVLVIFSEAKSEVEIERIFPPNFPVDKDRNGQEEITIGDESYFKSVASFVTKIEEHDGICLAAHVDSNQGIRYLFRQTGKETIELFNEDGKISKQQEVKLSEKFKDFLVAAKFHGIEVSKASDRQHYTWVTKCNGTRHHVPVFLTFDSHSIEDLSNNQRVTYVKTTDLSWKGLVEAIRFPNTRIRFLEDRVPPPHILGIEIINPNNKGFFSNLEIGFSENLNCIIGPRGSGKSTIVEAFRFVFGYNRTLQELESPDLTDSIKSRQETNLVESRIRIPYRLSDGCIHILEATYDAKSDYVTKVFTVDGKELPINDIEKSGNYPLRLFGWSEIETLGRNSQRQLDLLDKLIPGLNILRDQKRELYFLLSQNRSEILHRVDQLIEITNRNNQEIKQYQEYQRQFNELNTNEIKELFVTLDSERERQIFIKKLISIAGNVFDSLKNVSLDELIELEEDTLKSTVLAEWWPGADKFIELNKTNVENNKRLKEVKDSLSDLISRAQKNHDEIGNNITSISEQIRTKVSEDSSKQILTELRKQAKDRLDRVQALRDEYLECYEQFEELIKNRKSLLIQLLGVYRDISNVRRKAKQEIEGKLNEFQTDDMKISLEFNKNGNRTKLEDFLVGCNDMKAAHIQFKAKKWPQLMADRCTPIELAHCILEKRSSAFVSARTIENKTFSINQQEADQIEQALYPYQSDALAEITTVDKSKLITLMTLEEIEWDDRERILRNNQPVETSSPGQRSSAMLPLIALAESVPLIIDQPEDNLDNRLVGRVLVDILAKLKEKRQIIMSTHNPNIVVLGDAEQVIVLDAIDDKHGKVDRQASIDDVDIVSNVIDLMEGGRDAFETRSKRYRE